MWPKALAICLYFDPQLTSIFSEYVLKRDGTNVQTNSDCTAASGTWFSPYDGATWSAGSDVDIDHMVPLKNAWIVSPLSL